MVRRGERGLIERGRRGATEQRQRSERESRVQNSRPLSELITTTRAFLFWTTFWVLLETRVKASRAN